MTKQELNELVEKIIAIRDLYKMMRCDRDTLADACNVIYKNIDYIAEDGDKTRYITNNGTMNITL